MCISATLTLGTGNSWDFGLTDSGGVPSILLNDTTQCKLRILGHRVALVEYDEFMLLCEHAFGRRKVLDFISNDGNTTVIGRIELECHRRHAAAVESARNGEDS